VEAPLDRVGHVVVVVAHRSDSHEEDSDRSADRTE
jgi:hypothetical protein